MSRFMLIDNRDKYPCKIHVTYPSRYILFGEFKNLIPFERYFTDLYDKLYTKKFDYYYILPSI